MDEHFEWVTVTVYQGDCNPQTAEGKVEVIGERVRIYDEEGQLILYAPLNSTTITPSR